MNFIHKPFPFTITVRNRFLISFLFPVVVFVFLIIFQPFGIVNINQSKELFLLGFVGIVFFVLFTTLLIVPLFFKSFFNFETWTIKKNIILAFFQIIPISILNWIYNKNFNPNVELAQYSLFDLTYMSYAVSSIPLGFYFILGEKYFNAKNSTIAKKYTTIIQNNKNLKTSISDKKIILSESGQQFQIDLKQLVCIKSEGNYAVVYLLKNDTISQELIRTTLNKILQNLEHSNNIVRCHRSYIVNFDKIVKISGNARNLNLHFNDLDFSIPVSRSFPKELLAKIKEEIKNN